MDVRVAILNDNMAGPPANFGIVNLCSRALVGLLESCGGFVVSGLRHQVSRSVCNVKLGLLHLPG